VRTWKEYFKRPSPMKLYVLHTGNVHMAGNIHFNKKSPLFKSKPVDARFNPVLAFLVKHPSQGHILLDTGIHSSFATKASGNFGWLLASMVKVKASAGMDAVSRLAALGVSPGDISHVLLSHLHLDHPGGLPAFKSNTPPLVHVDTAELKIAHSPFGLFQGYIRKHLEGFKTAPLAYSRRVAPFDEVCDLFDDGSILVVKTPGHTPGHVSVVLNMQKGPLLLTFDAAHRRANLDEGIPTKGVYEQGLESVRRLQAFVKEFPSMTVIFGHDPDQIGSLKVSPDYYQ